MFLKTVWSIDVLTQTFFNQKVFQPEDYHDPRIIVEKYLPQKNFIQKILTENLCIEKLH